MAVATNKNTRQNPLDQGKTGTQSIRFLPAPRVYIKAEDSLTAAPVQSYYGRSNGNTPAGWTDLGIVEGFATVTYTKDINEIRTGVDSVLRQSYVRQKNADIQFNLAQFDDSAFENISGLSASTIISGSTINYQVGSEDVISKATLLVLVNKLDNKEIHLYSPSCDFAFSIVQNGDFMEMQVDGKLKSFTASGSAAESFFSITFYRAP